MTDGSGEPRLVVADAGSVPGIAAETIVRALAGAIDARGVAHWATTGGSVPPAVYRALLRSERRDEVAWGSVHIWWGDDRYVPRDHPLSNVKAVDDILLHHDDSEVGEPEGPDTGLRLPLDHVHPFRTAESIGAGHDAAWCAAELAAELAERGPSSPGGFPIFDLVFLGIGGDGHLLSVFPGSAAFDAAEWTMAIPAPAHIEPHVERVTMHPSIVAVAREVLVVITGAAKADIVAEILGPVREPRRWPAQVARHDRATWILDREAAGRLDR
jgi:6-phosphogluconolactonase